MMADLLIRIKKKTDGSVALSCLRSDGSVTWQRQEGLQGRFFPRHDLTHYAVETVLGHRGAFYGLVAEGWNLTDFGSPWPRGPLPTEANVSEMIVGFLDLERQVGERQGTDALNRALASFCAERGLPAVTPLSDDDVARIRAVRSDVFARWDAVEVGGTLELSFSRPAGSIATG